MFNLHKRRDLRESMITVECLKGFSLGREIDSSVSSKGQN